jgi:hypothetical protein
MKWRGLGLFSTARTIDFRRSAIATIGVDCYGFVTIPVPGTEAGCIPRCEGSDEGVIGFAKIMKLKVATKGAAAVQLEKVECI